MASPTAMRSGHGILPHWLGAATAFFTTYWLILILEKRNIPGYNKHCPCLAVDICWGYRCHVVTCCYQAAPQGLVWTPPSKQPNLN